ncbi:MAG: OmpA family protein [Alphaproteobacteria bacterium]|nr:OmpA family protein [Alphaproteobacteria bacterium]
MDQPAKSSRKGLPTATRRAAALVLLCALAGALAGPASALANEPVGTIKRVEGRPTIQRAMVGSAQEPQIQAVIGGPVYVGDTVRTKEGEGVGVLLSDDTVIAVGESSQVVLDQFVFDPAKGKAVLSAKLSEGSFQYRAGMVGKLFPGSVRLNMPAASVGAGDREVAGRVCRADDSACGAVTGGSGIRPLGGDEMLRGQIDPSRQKRASEIVMVVPDASGKGRDVEVSTAQGKQTLGSGGEAAVIGGGGSRGRPETTKVSESVVSSFIGNMTRVNVQPPREFVFLFESGSTTMAQQSAETAQQVKADLANRVHKEAVVVGHADSVGSAQTNLALSRARAEAVRDLLVESGIDASAVRVEARGAADPMVRAGGSEIRNRRVVVTVR